MTAAKGLAETEITLVALTVRTNRRLLPAVCALVRETALQAGLDSSQTLHLELLTEETCLVVIELAFQNRSDAHFDLLIKYRPGQIILMLQDVGLPFELAEAEAAAETSLGVRMLRRLSDELRFVNLANKGTCIEVVKNLDPTIVPDTLIEDLQDPDASPGVPISDLPIETRPMVPTDATSLARCMHFVYGYTYKKFVYFPDLIRDLLLSGRLYSYVAVTADQEVVAHQGLLRQSPGSPIAEITMGVVDPRFRGRGLFERLKKESFAEIARQGVYGLFGEAVTIHGYSQKANCAMGGRETGFLLNFISGERSFKAIAEREGQRQAVLTFYNRLRPEPVRPIHAPPAHRAVIEQIIAHVGLDRMMVPTEPALGHSDQPMPDRAAIEFTPLSEAGTVVIRVTRCGRDLPGIVADLTDRMCGHGFAVIYVDLPLSDPATPALATALEAQGFSFAAIFPEALDGDALRLQYLNSPLPDPRSITAVSPFAKDLLAYVIAAARAIPGWHG